MTVDELPVPVPMRTLLLLSELQAVPTTGGQAAALDRAVLLHKVLPLTLGHVDWTGGGDCQIGGLPSSFALAPVSTRRWVRTVWRALHSLGRDEPWFVSCFAQFQVRRKLLKAQAPLHAIVCFDNLFSTVAWDLCERKPRVYFAHNVEASIAEHFDKLSRRRAIRRREEVARHEARILRSADAVVCFTNADAEQLCRIAGHERVSVVAPAFREPAVRVMDPVQAIDSYVILPTNATWAPNVSSLRWFFDEVYPLLPKGLRFVLTGKDAGGLLQSLADSHEGVEYRGLLDRDAYDNALRCASLFVNPTRTGSGFQIKLMDALHAGIPIVSTRFSNPLGDAVCSSDDPVQMAALIEAWMCRREGIRVPDYAALHRTALDGLLAAMHAGVRHASQRLGARPEGAWTACE